MKIDFALLLVVAAGALVLCTFYEAPGADILAFAMGAQNAAATRFGDVTLNTVFITGNLQKLRQRLPVVLHIGHGLAQ